MGAQRRACAFVLVGSIAGGAWGCGADSSESPPPANSAGGGGGAAGAAGASGETAGASGTAGSAGSGGGAVMCDAAMAKALLDNVDDPQVFKCDPQNPEATAPWTCPALGDWSSFAHDCQACGTFDGTYPTPVQGKCGSLDPSGDAIAKASATGTPPILPDGRKLVPAGAEYVFRNDGTSGSFPFSAIRVPGTSYVIVSDDGYDDHYLRVVDTEMLAAGAPNPVVSQLTYKAPDSLNLGLAIGADGTIYAASGAPDAVIRAYQLDKTTGTISHDPAHDIDVGPNEMMKPTFPFGIAISPDGKTMLVGQVKGHTIAAFSLDPATYGKRQFGIDTGSADEEHISVVFDPKSSTLAYASLWDGQTLVELDLEKQTAKKIPVGKAPERIVFLDDNYLVVAASLDDSLSVVDRAAGTATPVPVEPMMLHGAGPSALAYDAAAKRLYATLSGQNAVEVFDVTPSTGPGHPPVITPSGFLPTSWWPTEVIVDGPMDPKPGALVVLNGKGHGTGPQAKVWSQLWGGLDGELMHGSIQRIDPPDASTLTTQSAAWSAASVPGSFAGVPKPSCGEDIPYDFPIPATNDAGPSPVIDHVVFIVRENKTYDDILGDLPNADGDPTLVMAPGKMDLLWPNFRKAAQTFAHADNFYEDAEQSIQGHYWTSFGRTSDYTERTWLSTWGRGTRGSVPVQGIDKGTIPVEGSIFSWLQANNIGWDNMGEEIGNIGQDQGYGFVSTSNLKPTDTYQACYMAMRARALCNLKPFTYAWYVDDHTFGASAGKPNPGVMIATNDEATGMFLDAFSHSPYWAKGLVVVVEDDPQDGADHVDAHRSVILMASPWVKHGYVSHTHFDVAGIHKLFAHIFGIPYNNQTVADAVVPFDMFTSTPDYTPYRYVPRKWTDLSCNQGMSKMSKQAEHWDFSEPDEQPGLGVQVREILRNGEQ